MIKIKWKEIEYDVDQQTWRLARMHISDIENRDEAQTDDNRETSKLLVLRFAESGNAMLGVALREKLQNTTLSVSTDALDRGLEEWSYSFKEMTEASERALAILIHKFIVLYCLYRWATIYVAEKASIFNKEMTDTLAEITSAVFTLSTPRKKRNAIIHELDNETEVIYD